MISYRFIKQLSRSHQTTLNVNMKGTRPNILSIVDSITTVSISLNIYFNKYGILFIGFVSTLSPLDSIHAGSNILSSKVIGEIRFHVCLIIHHHKKYRKKVNNTINSNLITEFYNHLTSINTSDLSKRTLKSTDKMCGISWTRYHILSVNK